LRAIPAASGAAIVPVVYAIVNELGLGAWPGALAASLVLLDTAILAQSRFVLLESTMILFSLLATLAALKMRKTLTFGVRWWICLSSAVTCMGAAFSVKYLAIYSCWLVCLLVARDWWRRLPDRHLPAKTLVLEATAFVSAATIVPTLIYICSFYAHLSVLVKAGAHDSLMTSAFQASLEGGLSSIVRGQPLEVAHGSQITLRHTHGRACWLHSHEHVYPVKYEDGRGSSHQQQVSCYGHKDVNNWWIVKRPDREDLAVHEPVDPVKDGEVIQLVHGMTHR